MHYMINRSIVSLVVDASVDENYYICRAQAKSGCIYRTKLPGL